MGKGKYDVWARQADTTALFLRAVGRAPHSADLHAVLGEPHTALSHGSTLLGWTAWCYPPQACCTTCPASTALRWAHAERGVSEKKRGGRAAHQQL